MTHMLTEEGHYSDPDKTLPELVGEVYGPFAVLQHDLHGGGVIYSTQVIEGEPVQLAHVFDCGEEGA